MAQFPIPDGVDFHTACVVVTWNIIDRLDAHYEDKLMDKEAYLQQITGDFSRIYNAIHDRKPIEATK